MRICFADVFFCFFPSVKNMRQPFLGTAERIFMKLLPKDRGGECSLKRRAAAWRMLICVIYVMTQLLDMANPYQSYAVTVAESPEGAMHGGCVIQP